MFGQQPEISSFAKNRSFSASEIKPSSVTPLQLAMIMRCSFGDVVASSFKSPDCTRQLEMSRDVSMESTLLTLSTDKLEQPATFISVRHGISAL